MWYKLCKTHKHRSINTKFFKDLITQKKKKSGFLWGHGSMILKETKNSFDRQCSLALFVIL